MNECAAQPRQMQKPGWLTFLGQWLRSPRRMASVAPSGKQLGRLMASAIPASSSRIVELGAGTGAITSALLHKGIPSEALLVVEMNPVFQQVLADRFPDIRIACGDARQLSTMLTGREHFGSGQVDVVCSSLGLLTMPADVQRDILAASFDVLGPRGLFVQYTYGLRPPLDDDVRAELGLECRRMGVAWLNLPPARVFVYSRSPDSQPVG